MIWKHHFTRNTPFSISKVDINPLSPNLNGVLHSPWLGLPERKVNK